MAANNTSENVKKSMTYLYSDLIRERERQREEKKEAKRLEKEARRESEDKEDQENPMSKKEKKEASIAKWQDIVIGLTGDDLDYIPQKKSKKKYKKWIGDEDVTNVITTAKPKKKKKKNYQKEFDPELNMLKALVSDQKKFTDDLQRRYQNAAGPNTKDAMPLNKTLVELAAVINSSRQNSLGVLREIGSTKKTIADLYMKHKKLEADLGGGGYNPSTSDLGLMGSDIFSSISSTQYQSPQPISQLPVPPVSEEGNTTSGAVQNYTTPNGMVFPTYDPSSWDGDGVDIGSTSYETIPKTIVVEWNKDSQMGRFKAIRNDNGEEIIGCPVPTCSVKSIDENTLVAKDDFDQVYPLRIIS